MDTLHSVLRNIRTETKSRRDHLTVFREFLDHLERVTRRGGKSKPQGKGGKAASSRRK